MKTVWLMGLLWGLFSCGEKKIFIDQIAEKKQWLNKSSLRSAEEFLEKRMQNKIKKVLGRQWQIVFQDEQHVYWGYTLVSSNRLFVRELFHTDKKTIQKLMPSFEKIDGSSLYLNVFLALQASEQMPHKDQKGTWQYQRELFTFAFSTQADVLKIKAALVFYPDNGQSVQIYNYEQSPKEHKAFFDLQFNISTNQIVSIQQVAN